MRPATPSNTAAVAAAIIQKADKRHPADVVLRLELRRLRSLTREQRDELSRKVFAYYRWFGWLDPQRPLPARVQTAADLALTFARKPTDFSNAELLARAVPGWTTSQVEVTPAWVRTLQSEPPLWLRARPGQAGALAAKLGQTKAGRLPEAVLYSGTEDLFHRREFQAGEIEIQDIASQAVGWLCAPQPGETWWDACAGEGGKTLHLSDLMRNKGLIWATDRAQWRLQRLKRRARRAGCFNCRVALWNGGERLPTKTRFDGVLVDAPCSGVGTWQRNPQGRWTTTLEDVRELAEVQKQLLLRTAPALRPGGRLVYAVCTLTRAETIEVADFIDQTLRGFAPLTLPALAALERPSAPRLWIWPEDLGGNGMFVAAWRKEP